MERLWFSKQAVKLESPVQFTCTQVTETFELWVFVRVVSALCRSDSVSRTLSSK